MSDTNDAIHTFSKAYPEQLAAGVSSLSLEEVRQTATSFPFLRLPAELQIKICRYYIGKPFSISVHPQSDCHFYEPCKHKSTLEYLHVRTSGRSFSDPSPTSLLQASPDLYERAHAALLEVFIGRVSCSIHWGGGALCPINAFLEKLLASPLPRAGIKSIVLEIDQPLFEERDTPPPFEADWKRFVSLFTKALLPNLRHVSIALVYFPLPGLLRGRHDIEPFLQGQRDDVFVNCVQEYLPKMKAGDPEGITCADGGMLAIKLRVRCWLYLFPEFQHLDPSLGNDLVSHI